MWVVVALCILVALAALVLSVPVDFGLRVVVHGRPSVYLRVEWLFGRVKKTYRSSAGAQKSEKKSVLKPGKDEGAPKREKARNAVATAGSKGHLAWQLVSLPGLWRSVIRLVVRLFRCIRVRELRSDFRVDLGDPVDTALIVGGVSQAAMMANVRSEYAFRVTPSFLGDPVVDGEAVMAVRLRPICTVPPLLRFLFSLSTLRAMVLVVRYRCRKDR